MTDEWLLRIERALKERHPVMAAMATKLERVVVFGLPTARLTFDGPALPEKVVHDFGMEANIGDGFASALRSCENVVAEAIRRAR